MSRYPIRARVFKVEIGWRVQTSSGRRLTYRRWSSAMAYANVAVRKERRFTALQEFASREYVGRGS